MKNMVLAGAILALSLALYGCGGQSADPDDAPEAEGNQISAPSSPEPEQSADSDLSGADEGAPEYLTSACTQDTTDIAAYYYSFVDGRDVVFKLADISFPSQLIVQETTQVLTGGETDLNLDELTVADYAGKGEGRYVYFRADGTIEGSCPTTSHRLSFSVGQQDEPFTLEYVESLRDDAVVSEISEEGIDGYIVVPDGVSPDGGFVYANMYINAGTYEYADGVDNFVIEISYEGGMMDYADVDFEELKAALLDLVKPDFRQV